MASLLELVALCVRAAGAVLGALFLVVLVVGMLPIIGAFIVGWLTTGLLMASVEVLYAAGRAARAIVRYIRATSVLALLQEYLRFGNRWRVLVPVVLVAPASFIPSFLSVNDMGGGSFLQDQSTFFQTSAQVGAALLVALAASTISGRESQIRALSPALRLGLIGAAVAEVASIAALVSQPQLTASLQPVAYSLTVSGGATALLAFVLSGYVLLIL